MVDVYLWENKYCNEIFEHRDEFIKNHPENYLFSYDGDFKWEWYTIQLGERCFHFCMGSSEKETNKKYFVEEFHWSKNQSSITSSRTAFCPACGSPLDWEEPDGEIKCSICYSTIKKVSNYYIDIDDIEHLDYQTALVKIKKPYKLDSKKVKVLTC
jgi:hypothetical protein